MASMTPTASPMRRSILAKNDREGVGVEKLQQGSRPLPSSPARSNLAGLAGEQTSPIKCHRALPMPPGTPKGIQGQRTALPTVPTSPTPTTPRRKEGARAVITVTPERAIGPGDFPSPKPAAAATAAATPTKVTTPSRGAPMSSDRGQEPGRLDQALSLRTKPNFGSSSTASPRQAPVPYSPTKFAEQIRVRGIKSRGNLHEREEGQGGTESRTEPVHRERSPMESSGKVDLFSKGLGLGVDAEKFDVDAPRQDREVSAETLTERDADAVRTHPSIQDDTTTFQFVPSVASSQAFKGPYEIAPTSPASRSQGLSPKLEMSPKSLASSLRDRANAVHNSADVKPADEQGSRIFSYSSILDSYEDESDVGHHTGMVFAALAKLDDRVPEPSSETHQFSMIPLRGSSPKYAEQDDSLLDARRPSDASSFAVSDTRHSFATSSRTSHTTMPTSHSAASDAGSHVYGAASSLRKSIDLSRKRSFRDIVVDRQEDYGEAADLNRGLVRDDTTLFHQDDDVPSRLRGQDYSPSSYRSPSLALGVADGGDEGDSRSQVEIDSLSRDSRMPSMASVYSPVRQGRYDGIKVKEDYRDVTPRAHRQVTDTRTIRDEYNDLRPIQSRRVTSNASSPVKLEQRPSPFRRPDEKRKLVVVGDGGAGKTALLIRYAKGSFPEAYVPTIFENYVTQVNHHKSVVEMALWDTAGQEDYDRLRPLSYPDSNVVLICFSIDSESSFNNVVEKWAPEIVHFLPTVPTVLVALKTDLRHHRATCISRERGHRLAKEIGAAAYVECSAREGTGVQDVFEAALNVTLPDDSDPSNLGFALGRRKKKARMCRIM